MSSLPLPPPPTSPSAAPAEQRDDEALLFLAEMFPNRSFEQIQRVVLSSPPTATVQELTERLLQEPEDDAVQSNSSNIAENKREDEKEEQTETAQQRQQQPTAYEMVSLVPPNIFEPSAPPLPPQQEADITATDALMPVPSAPTFSPRELTLHHALAELHTEVLHAKQPWFVQHTCLTALQHIFQNLLTHPTIGKYRVLSSHKLSFQNKIAVLPSAVALLHAVGFESIDGQLLILSEEQVDTQLIKDAEKGIQKELDFLTHVQQQQQQQQEAVISPLKRQYDQLTDNPLYQTKRQWKDTSSPSSSSTRTATNTLPAPTPRLTRDQLAAVAEHRLHPKSSSPPPLPPTTAPDGIRRGRIMDLNHQRRLRHEIDTMRKEQKHRWLTTGEGRKRVFTMADLAAMRQRELDAHAKMGTGMLADDELLEIGKEAVRLTNEYRISVGLPGNLVWHQVLAEIGWGHSRAMGDHQVPFNHDGFHDRVRRYGFPHRGAGENLFMCHGVPASIVAKQAVDGWIQSPGHRKNLEGDWYYCGIGVYRNAEGAFYLTQLFAKI